jgi:hypothetical protein
MNYYLSQHPESYLSAGAMAHICNGFGRTSLEGNVLKRPGKPPCQTGTSELLAAALDENFGIMNDKFDYRT